MRAHFIRDDGAIFALTPENGYQDASGDDWLPEREVRQSVYELTGRSGSAMAAQSFGDWTISFNGIARRSTPRDVWAQQGRFYAFFALGHYYRLVFETCAGYITIPRLYISAAPTFTIAGKMERFANYKLTMTATDVFAYECAAAQLERYDQHTGRPDYVAHYVELPAYIAGQPAQPEVPAVPEHTETRTGNGYGYTSSGYKYGASGYDYGAQTYTITIPGTPAIPAKPAVPAQNDALEVFAPFGTIKSADGGSQWDAGKLETNTAGTIYTIEPKVMAEVYNYPSGATIENLTTGQVYALPTYSGSQQADADPVELAIGRNILRVHTVDNTGTVTLRWAGALLC